jgi:hypothetical protein
MGRKSKIGRWGLLPYLPKKWSEPNSKNYFEERSFNKRIKQLKIHIWSLSDRGINSTRSFKIRKNGDWGEIITTFKQYFNGDVVANANPFSRRDKAGDTEWKSGNNKLKLIFKLGSGLPLENHVDGWVSIKVKTGFKVTFTIKSSDFNAFTSVGKSFKEQGYKSSRINYHNSGGLGGDSNLDLSLLGGDMLRLSDTTGITLNLRRDEGIEAGGWATSDNLSASADISLTMVDVIRYTEKTGDWEGIGDEESDKVEVDPDDIWGVGEDDTPIDEDYHPTTDDSLGTVTTTWEPNALMGVLYSVLLVTVLGAMWGRSSWVKRSLKSVSVSLKELLKNMWRNYWIRGGVNDWG